jgi:Rieske Fe-S protein
MMWLTAGLGVLASAAIGVPVVGYLLGVLLVPEKDDWVSLGPVKDFPEHTTRTVHFDNPHRQKWDGATGKAAAFVRRLGGEQFQVFAVNCAHLGCPVAWFPQSGLFLCPCHGGVYYEDGRRASGPPPRGLYSYEWTIEDGQLKILAGHLPTLHDTLHPEKHT